MDPPTPAFTMCSLYTQQRMHLCLEYKPSCSSLSPTLLAKTPPKPVLKSLEFNRAGSWLLLPAFVPRFCLFTGPLVLQAGPRGSLPCGCQAWGCWTEEQRAQGDVLLGLCCYRLSGGRYRPAPNELFALAASGASNGSRDTGKVHKKLESG